MRGLSASIVIISIVVLALVMLSLRVSSADAGGPGAQGLPPIFKVGEVVITGSNVYRVKEVRGMWIRASLVEIGAETEAFPSVTRPRARQVLCDDRQLRIDAV